MASPHVVIAVGASAGGVEALSRFASALPPDLPAAVVVVLHVAPYGRSVLADILTRSGPLPATPVDRTMHLQTGRIYVAPPAHHVLVEQGSVVPSRGPRENGHRPAIDPLFRSVAAAYGTHSVGIVLSGTRDDGTAGLARIRRAGGLALVQDPSEALYSSMPSSAINGAGADHVLPVEELARCAADFSRTDLSERRGTDVDGDVADGNEGSGSDTRLTCPDCGGVLFRHSDEGLDQLRCSVGHGYSLISYDAEQGRMVEHAVSAALRLLGDRATFLRDMSARQPGNSLLGKRYEARAVEIERHVETLRMLVEGIAAEASTEAEAAGAAGSEPAVTADA